MKTSSQKTLKILSIIVIVLAALTAVSGVVATYLGGLFMAGGVEVLDQLGTSEEGEMMAGGGFIALVAGVFMLISGIIDISVGVIGLGVAKDGRRIKLYTGLCIFALVCIGLAIIMSFVDGTFTIFSLIPVLVVGLALRCALDIKNAQNVENAQDVQSA